MQELAWSHDERQKAQLAAFVAQQRCSDLGSEVRELKQGLAAARGELYRSQIAAQESRRLADRAETELVTWRARARELQQQLARCQQAAAASGESFALSGIRDGIVKELRAASASKDLDRRVRALLLTWHPDKHPFQQQLATRVTQTIIEVKSMF